MKHNQLKLYYDLKHLNEINKQNLLKIMEDNKYTAYGRKYDFESILNIKDYQSKVPFTTYQNYLFGNPSAYSIRNILHTTGTTGNPKIIYLTGEALSRYQSVIYDFPKQLLGIKRFKAVHTSVFRIHETPTILSAAYYHYLLQIKALSVQNYVEGADFLFTDELFCISYVKLRFALAEENLMLIESIYLYEIELMLDYLFKHWQILLYDMKKNCCSITLPKKVAAKVNDISCNKERILYLESLFYEYRGSPPLNKIWPKLAYLSGIGQKNSSTVQRIQYYAKSISIYYFSYASTECMCGIATKMNEDEYVLLPQSAFYEFLDDKGQVYLPNEVSIGQKYELVFTTFSGLYRYQSNDLLWITGFQNQSPIFKVLGRKNKVLNIAGEKVDEWTIHESMRRVIKDLHLQNIQYMIGIDTLRLPARYILYTNIPENLLAKGASDFDRELCQWNSGYESLRQNEYIAKPKMKYYKNLSKMNHSLKPKLFLTDEEMKQLEKEY